MKKLRVICMCGYGMGSCLVLKWTAEEVLNKHGIPAEVIAADIGSGKGLEGQIVIMSGQQAQVTFSKNGVPGNKKIITIKNYTSRKEMEEKLIPVAKEIMGM